MEHLKAGVNIILGEIEKNVSGNMRGAPGQHAFLLFVSPWAALTIKFTWLLQMTTLPRAPQRC